MLIILTIAQKTCGKHLKIFCPINYFLKIADDLNDESFNQYFSTIGTKLTNNTSTTSVPRLPVIDAPNESFNLRRIEGLSVERFLVS